MKQEIVNKKEISESGRLIHYLMNRQDQIKKQEKICEKNKNKTDLIKLQSKQIQLFHLLDVIKTINEL
jgi:hypothetical protein